MRRKITLFLALFFLVKMAQSQVVITEIMYNPPESGTDSLEFIEIYNAGSTSVEMQGYTLSFGGNVTRYTFTSSYSFAPSSYLVFAVNANAVKNQYKLSFNPIQWAAAAGLGNTSSIIKLFNASNTIIDSVSYSSSSPWPAGAPNGLGASINLCNYSADNSLATNWAASNTVVGTTINTQALKASPGAREECVLPVKWLSTAVASNNSQVTISWQVAELFTQYYVIEKSTDAKSFVSVATVNSKGDGINNYSASLFDNSTTTIYYRIKQVDMDGKHTYSSTLQIVANGKLGRALQVYPNPAISSVVLSIDKAFVGANIQLTNVQGKVIRTINATQASFSFDISRLTSGFYYFKLPNQAPVKVVKL